jgi:dienelactone hydrolase
MKKWNVLIYILFCLNASAQYKIIEYSDIKNWPSLHSPSLSPNGRYAAYLIKTNGAQVSRLCIRSFNKGDTLDIENVEDFSFAMDSKHLIYRTIGKDALNIVNLATKKERTIDSVLSYQFIEDKVNDWLIIRKTGMQSKMEAVNLGTNRILEYDSINKIHLLKDGCCLLVEKETRSSNLQTTRLEYINLKEGKQRLILSGKEMHSFDFNGNTIQFYVRYEDPNGGEYIDVYDARNWRIKLLKRKRIDSLHLVVDRFRVPCSDSRFVFFYGRDPLETASYHKDTSHSKVRIWSYLDQQLKTLREETSARPRNFLYGLSLTDGKVFRVEQKNEEAIVIDSGSIIIRRQEGDCHLSEANWNKACKNIYYLFSTTNYSRGHLPSLDGLNVSVSPARKYLSYYDDKLQSYCLFNISTGRAYPVTEDIKDATWDYHFNKGVLRGIAGWLPADKGILIYDTYDIYLVDPTGNNPGKCLTDNMGKRTKTAFAVTFDGQTIRPFNNKNQLLVTAFNITTKDNGFFVTTLSGGLKSLSMGPYIYDISRLKAGTEFPPEECNFIPLQAKSADVYMVKRTGATEFGNYYLTKDFNRYEKISDLHPEKGFNWYTSELHNWYSADSTKIQGILYKPYDFDSTKKYPIIFQYYDKKSDGLHAYITPNLLENGSSINIPYYVSRGYLIALVDIHFKIGYAGHSALQSLVSAARHFSQYRYVDSTRYGIEGFSFGGYLTYYLVTHTSIFAAANAGAGATDVISHFGTLKAGKYPAQELSQYRIGKMLWESPEIFVENSPVMVSKDVVTPLLMMNNTNDGAVNVRQAIEFFTALRRQGKKVWFLEYLEGDHGVHGEDEFDYCLRKQQFFDHYLKGKPLPEWMLKEN